MIKILAIGNSFSQDATALLELFDLDLYVRNLYIPGCPLSYHSELIKTKEPAYEYQECGESCIPKKISLEDGLKSECWDFVTIQQASGLSGIEESYYPYISELVYYLRRSLDIPVVFHQTWAYETGSEHEDFARYDYSQKKMYQCIKQTTEKVCAKENLSMIRMGELIARLRKYDFFNTERGGISLCRDGFHLSFNFGRCAAAGIWAKFFTKKIPDFFFRDSISEGFRIIREELSQIDL